MGENVRDDWQAKASCRDHEHPEWWFPERNEGHTVKLAKEVCRSCPVMLQCREAGMREHFGIWGGLSEKQRSKVRGKHPKRCEICGNEFEARYGDRYCSPRCQKIGFRAYQRDYQRRHTDRVNGTMLNEGHGTISRRQKGCACQACRAAVRENGAVTMAKRWGKAS